MKWFLTTCRHLAEETSINLNTVRKWSIAIYRIPPPTPTHIFQRFDEDRHFYWVNYFMYSDDDDVDGDYVVDDDDDDNNLSRERQ